MNLHLSPIDQSQVSLRSLCAYFVRQMEPKILRLVSFLRGVGIFELMFLSHFWTKLRHF